MHIDIDVPEEVGRHLETRWGNLSRRAAEALALEGYRAGILTDAQVQQMLALPSRWAVETLLHRAHAYVEYTDADLDHDLDVLRRVRAV